MKGYRKSIETIEEILSSPANEKGKLYEVRDFDFEGKPALVVTMDAKAMLAGNPAANNPVTEKLFGPDGKLRVYIAPADNNTVLMAYVSEENLKQTLANYRSGKSNLGKDPQVAETAALLPDGAQWVGYLSPTGMFRTVRTFVGAVVPRGQQINLPDFPESPPVGFAVKVTTTELDTDLVFPSKTIKATGEYVQKVRGAQ
jgi:hypothetical protein